MDNEFEFIIRAINDLYNNIWVGDLKAARSSAIAAIDEFRKRIDLSELENTTSKLKRIVQKARRDSKEVEVKNKRLWVLERISDEVKEADLDLTKNTLGILWAHLQSLAEAVEFIMEVRNQKTLDNLHRKSAVEEQHLREGERYRYSVHHLPDGWEVRAMLDKPPEKWGLKGLRGRLPKSFFVEEISRKTSSDLFALYSSEMYLQVLRQKRLIKITIHTPSTDDVEKRIEKIAETILTSFVQQTAE